MGAAAATPSVGGHSRIEVQIVHGDLQDVDVTVNAWNRNIIPWWLLLPQDVSRAIKKRGGYFPFRELGKFGPMALGGDVMAGAGKLFVNSESSASFMAVT